jgi:putative phage-type endonuclease
MSKIIQLTQGSPEWLAYRLTKRNASETPAVMGVSPWVSPYQLWQQRTGRSKQEVNAAMARGTALEPAARRCYERLTGLVVQPLVVEAGEYSASLDGRSFDGRLGVEIKCPVKGRDSTLWKSLEQGLVPEHYGLQVEHQLMVCGAEEIHLFVYDEETDSGLLQAIRPQPARWGEIDAAWEAFMKCIHADTPPALSALDKVMRTDALWSQAAKAYIQRKAEADEAAQRMDKAKEALIALTQHTSESGAGVTVTRFWKQGAVDYKKVPQLQGVDLDAYRGATRQEVRLSLSKD